MALTAPTWHNSARIGDFAPTVLMPGDPKRSAWIAKTYLENAVLVNDVRGVQGYTGSYKGARVSVMASGMGVPAVAIYAHELFNVYGVNQIIRIGTAGAIDTSLKVMDVVAASSATTDSNYGRRFGYPFGIAPTADFTLMKKADAAATRLGFNLRIGPFYCSDMLYDAVDYLDVMRCMHLLASEMESPGLYLEAMRAGKRAITLCTIVEDPVTGLEVEPQARETALHHMVLIALECALNEG